MLELLSDKLQKILNKLSKVGKLKPAQVEEALRKIKLVLLEADVNFKVVKGFIEGIKSRATGEEVLKSLTPTQSVIKIVNEEMTKLLGGAVSEFHLSLKPPTLVMMIGLQGSGKTTATAKISKYFQKQNKKTLMVAADIVRPAAVEQLKVLGEDNDIDVFSKENTSTLSVVKKGKKHAVEENYDVVVFDTAGRIHIDDKLMGELKEIKKSIHPHQILLVLDSMTGQDAVNLAKNFNEKVGIDGVILTKLDGDARGGAALSVVAITGKPIKFVSLGEGIDSFEPFYPDRMASRVLGMGDILGLIEKAEKYSDEEKAKELTDKIRKNQLNLEDYLEQIKQMKKMGPVSELVKMLPQNILGKGMKNFSLNENQIKRMQAILQSMTLEERSNPNIINGSRKKRIASGSGTSVQEVNRLIKQFYEAKKIMKNMSKQKSMSFGRGMFPF